MGPEMPIGHKHRKPRSLSRRQMPWLRHGLFEQESPSASFSSGCIVFTSAKKNKEKKMRIRSSLSCNMHV